MANRTRQKRTNYDDEIIRIDMQIERYESSIQALTETRKQLIEQKDKVEISMLHDTIKRSGRSVQDIIQALEEISQRKTYVSPTPIQDRTHTEPIEPTIMGLDEITND